MPDSILKLDHAPETLVLLKAVDMVERKIPSID